MFEMNEFLKDNLVNGYHNGSFTLEQVNIFAMNYRMRGIVSQADFQEIQERIAPPVVDGNSEAEVES